MIQAIGFDIVTRPGEIRREAELWLLPAYKAKRIKKSALPTKMQADDFIDLYQAAVKRRDIRPLVALDDVGAKWPADIFSWMVKVSKTMPMQIETVMALCHAIFYLVKNGKIERKWLDPIGAKKDAPEGVFSEVGKAAKNAMTPVIIGLGAIAAGYIFLTKKRN